MIIYREGFLQTLYNIDDLQYTNDLHVGHLFYSIMKHFNKTPEQYGTRWVKFRNSDGDISNAFRYIESEVNKLDNDFDKLVLVLSHLGEELPVEEEPNDQSKQV